MYRSPILSSRFGEHQAWLFEIARTPAYGLVTCLSQQANPSGVSRRAGMSKALTLTKRIYSTLTMPLLQKR